MEAEGGGGRVLVEHAWPVSDDKFAPRRLFYLPMP